MVFLSFCFNRFTNPLVKKCKTFPTYKYSTCPKNEYSAEVEKAINEQINAELYAFYTYLSMASYFGRTDVALPGSQVYFYNMHLEEHEHAQQFINYQNLRGGKVVLSQISVANSCGDWKGICYALNAALDLEKQVKEKLEKLTKVAEENKDLGAAELISSTYIPDQDRSICELSRLLTRSKKMLDSGASEYLFDKELHKAFHPKNKTIPGIPNVYV